MRRLISSLTLLLFFIWILPLGVFIRPSDAKRFCNGQRAICLCAHLVAKHKPSTMKVFAAQQGGVEKESPVSGGGGGNHYLITGKLGMPGASLSRYFEETFSLYSLVVPRSIEHVPKA